MIRFSLLALGFLGACNSDKDKGTGDTVTDDTASTDTDTATDSGDSADSADTGTDTAPPCETIATATTPEDETTDWFYRDNLSVTFSDDASGATLQILGPDGAEVPSTAVWSDGNFQVEVVPDAPLVGSTTYTLHIGVCSYTGDVSFTTSVYGGALEEEPATLVGNTYVFDMSKADIVQPEGLGYLLASYLTEPLLIGVDHLDTDTNLIGLIGAQGYKKSDGTYKQASTEVWIFPDADFASAPYFEAATPSITIDYGDASIPIENFALEGTFSPDGQSIGGGHASGLGDTRDMGPLLGLGDNPTAVCSLIDSLGLTVGCEACSDGEELCLFLEVNFDEAEIASGVTIVAP